MSDWGSSGQRMPERFRAYLGQNQGRYSPYEAFVKVLNVAFAGQKRPTDTLEVGRIPMHLQ